MKRRRESQSDEESSTEELEGKDDEKESSWSSSEIIMLLESVEGYIPPDDDLKFETRLKKIMWDKIQIGKHSSIDGKVKFESILQRIRKYRTLSEIVTDAKYMVKNPGSKRNIKKVQHPDKPKRPLTSYLIFLRENKDKMRAENPNMDMTSITQALALKYNSLSEKKKNKYFKKAQVDKERYLREIEEFFRKHPEERVIKGKSSLKGPQPPKTAFAIYQESVSEKGEINSKMELREYCLRKWKNMTDKKKGKYINKAQRDWERYQKELAVYLEDDPNYVTPYNHCKITKEELSIMSRLSGKPEKPPNSGYSIFSTEMFNKDEMKSFPPKDKMKEISKMWNLLSESEKSKYKQRAKHMLEDYKYKFDQYLDTLTEDEKKKELGNMPRAPLQTDAFKAYVREMKKSYEEKCRGVSKAKLRRLMEVDFEALPDDAKAEYQKKLSDTKKPLKSKKKASLFKGEPVPLPSSAYRYFLRNFLRERKEYEIKDRMKKALKTWHGFSKEEKHEHEQNFMKAKREYILAYKEFLESLNPEELKEFLKFKQPKSLVPNTVKKDAADARDDSDAESEENKLDSGAEEDSDAASGGSEADEGDGKNTSDIDIKVEYLYNDITEGFEPGTDERNNIVSVKDESGSDSTSESDSDSTV